MKPGIHLEYREVVFEDAGNGERWITRSTERCVHELVETLGIAQSLASQHLRILRGAGLVRSR